MNREELKKKIADIVLGVEWTGCLGNTYHISGGMSVANAIADALIKAGIGDVTEWKEKAKKHRVQVLPDGTIKQLYSDEEVEDIARQRNEYKHRAEVAERALQKFAEYITCYDCPFFSDCDSSEKMEDLIHSNYCFAEYLRQAEKELAEERKDEN